VDELVAVVNAPDRPPWPTCKPCSIPSATFTTTTAPTAPCRQAPPPHRPTPPYPKPPAGLPTGEHFRIRHDTVDQFGKLTLRYASRLRHLGIGRDHAGTKVLILVTTVTVVSKTHHRVLSSHRIEPDRNYWRNQNKNPGRWPGNL
jgi:hypothetical protein